MGSIYDSDIQIRTIFITNTDLHRAILSNNASISWRIEPLISNITDYLSYLGNPHIHIVPRSWMNVAVSLAFRGLNSHALTLFLQGRDLPFWLMKLLNSSGILL